MRVASIQMMKTMRVGSPGLILAGLFLLLGFAGGCAGPGSEKPDPHKLEEQRHLAAYNYNLAERFWERNRLDLALRYLGLAVRRDPQAANARLKILDLYLVNDDPSSALMYLEDCPPNLLDTAPFFNRRVLALELGDREEEAAPLIEEASARGPLDPDLVLALAECRFLKGKTEAAFSLLEGELARNADRPAYLEQLADFCRATKRFHDEALYRMQRACLPRTRDRATHLREAAGAFIRAAQMDEGIRRFRTMDGMETFPDEGVRQACLGVLYHEKGAVPEAVACFESAFACKSFKPESAELLTFSELRMREGKPGQAALLLQDELARDPNQSLTRAALAWAYYCAGSMEQCSKVIASAPDPIEDESLLARMRQRLEEEGYEN